MSLNPHNNSLDKPAILDLSNQSVTSVSFNNTRLLDTEAKIKVLTTKLFANLV